MPDLSNKDELFKYQLNLIEKEIISIESKINPYDSYSLVVKGWAITIWAGIIIWAFQSNNYQFIWISFFPIGLFWIFDAFFKEFQRRHIIRGEWIQDFLNNKGYFKKNKCSLEKIFESKILPESLLIFDSAGRINYTIIPEFKERIDKVGGFLTCLLQRYNSYIYTGLIISTMVILTIQACIYWIYPAIVTLIIMIILILLAHKRGRDYRHWDDQAAERNDRPN